MYSSFCGKAQQLLPYKNSRLPIETRVQDLLSRMSPEEKFWQLFMIPGDLDKAAPDQYKNGLFGFQVSAATTGAGEAAQQMLSYNQSKENALTLAKKINGIQRYFIENTRLGIPLLFFDEALHGLVRSDATSFPQSIGLAATFDTAIMRQVANAIADETKQRGIRQILTPVVNLATDVRWGRTEETYGEDPFLTSAMGVVFVSAFEKKNIVTTPKHFVANVGDGGRDSYPIHWSERFLEETHFLPFKACFQKGGSRSVMTAYNSLDGTACTANSWLLNTKLKKEWGFNGFVISDAGATGGALVLHHTAKDYPESGVQAINGGLDVIFQTDYQHYKLFAPHFYDGKINQERIDDAVARVLRAKFELGLFETPYVDEKKAAIKYDHKPVAKQAALESLVLLKNEDRMLPFAKTIRKLAVIGTDAAEARLGGYSGPGTNKVSILEGLKEKNGATTEILYAPGPGRSDKAWKIIPADLLWHAEGTVLKRGLRFSVFDRIDFSGTPVDTGTDQAIDKLWTLSGPSSKLQQDFYAVRWEGMIRPDASGDYRLGLSGNDGFRLYLDDELVIDNWKKESFRTALVPVSFVKGKTYKLKVEYYEPVGNGKLQLIFQGADDRAARIREAVAVAEKADAVVIAAGIEEGEFRDRALLSLPGMQEELIQRVSKTGKPVVVLLVGGSAITMSNWICGVKSVLQAWYPGEEGGRAVADVLMGDYNPAGRLPITFPLHEAQLPLVYNHKPTGRGDDYENLSGRPLFPFGFGLSYTTFEYSNIRLDKPVIGIADSVRVHFTIKNTGTMAGDEVPQLYIRDDESSLAQPVLALKGLQRVLLKPGDTKELDFLITPELLQLLNQQMKWVVEPGSFSIMIGASSADIRLRTTLIVE
ncbi:glycoside hydrolase family 3 C-terminal domain-containing protein [Niabella sp. CC-SYL272]|uniref:glycoside hydrolase family 3 N-terminal domain-containing protein n=1 Tax=Niabella agricola TaxID=2891571 RepID=UPI001F1F2286|nr:glycoside hydrolase family 3 N-terminal domain-containing protein [Niabella agricola]MCF3111041.1 glycoside hydrolase family 3 C-terminal domain-containing protein [Niabella agricola]